MPPMRRSASRPAQSASLSSGRRLTPRRFAQPSSVRLSDLGELGLLAELERRGLAEQIENDAAQLGDGLVVTQDSLVEGVHFRLDWLSWRELGFRAAAVNISDLRRRARSRRPCSSALASLPQWSSTTCSSSTAGSRR